MKQKERVKGKVKWYNPQKRYGYITDAKGNDFFIHESGIIDGRIYTGYDEGDTVEFEIVQGKKGPYAKNANLVI